MIFIYTESSDCLLFILVKQNVVQLLILEILKKILVRFFFTQTLFHDTIPIYNQESTKRGRGYGQPLAFSKQIKYPQNCKKKMLRHHTTPPFPRTTSLTNSAPPPLIHAWFRFQDKEKLCRCGVPNTHSSLTFFYMTNLKTCFTSLKALGKIRWIM